MQTEMEMFRMIGLGENIGSGFPLILSAWNEKHWLKPELIEQRELLQVKLVLTIETKDEDPIVSEDDIKKKSDTIENVQKNVQKDILEKLTVRQSNEIELIIQTPHITLQEMSSRLHVSVKTIQRDFDAMRKLGVAITRKNGRTHGEWEVRS